jgi:hypothetical protein
MAEQGCVFSPSGAQRIVAAVRAVEAQPLQGGSGQPGASRYTSPAGLWQVTAVNEGAGTCTVKRVNADNTLVAASEQDVGIDADYPPAADDRGTLLTVADFGLRFSASGGGAAGTFVDPATVGTTAETEAAQTDDWDQADQGANDGVAVTMLTRFGYVAGSDEKLYAYYRTFTYDSVGQMRLVSAETRVEIDAPVEDCST